MQNHGAIHDFSSLMFAEVATASHASASPMFMPSPLNCESEQATAAPLGQRTTDTENLVCEFTRDECLLEQYYRLYKSECRVIKDIPSFQKSENDQNHNSHIIVVRKGKLCVGGARLTISTPIQPRTLPMEISGFKLATHFSELQNGRISYGELSRLVILPELRNGDLTRRMLWALYHMATAVGMKKMFAVAPLTNVRHYKRNAALMGLTHSNIFLNIDIPPYPGFEDVKDYLLAIDIVDRSIHVSSDRELRNAGAS